MDIVGAARAIRGFVGSAGEKKSHSSGGTLLLGSSGDSVSGTNS